MYKFDVQQVIPNDVAPRDCSSSPEEAKNAPLHSSSIPIARCFPTQAFLHCSNKVCLEADACLKSAQQQQHELLQLSPHLHGRNGHQARSWVSLLKGIPKIQKFLCLHTLKQHTWEIRTKLDWLYGAGFTTNP